MPDNVLVLNAGSSSLKFALFQRGENPRRIASGVVERVGRENSELVLKSPSGASRRRLAVEDHSAGIEPLWRELASNVPESRIGGVAHRIVHGGPKYFEPQPITAALVAELRRLSPFDPQHLPAEIALIAAVAQRAEGIPQVACFDTAFHRDLPRVARVLPIPRRFEASGIRRYGFHGLSYEFLLGELSRLGDPAASQGRVVLGHLGNGASLAAVLNGRCIDTTMSFTPAAGLVMGTRAGDLDPGLADYLHTVEGMSPADFSRMINRESGLLGISETSSDMRDLLAREKEDVRAAEAVAIFCYQASKAIGAHAVALGGLDTLVFAGGIGEHSAPVRERICARLEHLGLAIHPTLNAGGEPIVSTSDSRVSVRVMRTDEEVVIARHAYRLLASDGSFR